MATRPTFLNITFDVRSIILEILLVSDDPIKLRRIKYTKDNSASPTLTNISRTCRQLSEEAKAVFFSKNSFLFGVPAYMTTVQPFFSPEFNSGPRARAMKLLMQNITIPYVLRKDWSGLRFFYLKYHSFDNIILNALNALKSYKEVRNFELLAYMPPSVYLCDEHFAMHQKQHNLPQVPRDDVWHQCDVFDTLDRYDAGKRGNPGESAQHHRSDLEPFGVRKETDTRMRANGFVHHFPHIETLRDLNIGAALKIVVLDQKRMVEKEVECSWYALSWIWETIKRVESRELGVDLEMQKGQLKVFGKEARKLSPLTSFYPNSNC